MLAVEGEGSRAEFCCLGVELSCKARREFTRVKDKAKLVVSECHVIITHW